MAADPLEALRQPAVPMAPPAEFSRELRLRIERALTHDRGGVRAMTTATATHPITPYLCTRGAAAAIDFYREAFGATERMRMTGDDGRIGHAEITIGDAVVMLADEHPEIGFVSPATLGGSSITLYLDVDDVDATYARALAAGAHGERAPADQFHGHRGATLRDPFGHRWMVTMTIEDLSIDELDRRAPGYTTTGGEPTSG